MRKLIDAKRRHGSILNLSLNCIEKSRKTPFNQLKENPSLKSISKIKTPISN